MEISNKTFDNRNDAKYNKNNEYSTNIADLSAQNLKFRIKINRKSLNPSSKLRIKDPQKHEYIRSN